MRRAEEPKGDAERRGSRGGSATGRTGLSRSGAKRAPGKAQRSVCDEGAMQSGFDGKRTSSGVTELYEARVKRMDA